MERIDTINRQRVAWCCAERGVTPDELARDVGIAPQTIARFFEGGGLTFLQLRKIANYFGRGVLFFMEEAPAEGEVVHSAHYRTLTNTKPGLSFQVKKLIERVEHQRELYLALREDLAPDDYVQFAEPFDVSPGVAQAAAHARRWLGLAQENSFEAYRAAVQARGILVFRTNGYAGSWQIPKDSPILGFSLYERRCPVIVVRKSPYETQQTFTLMHELGHLLLHKESSIDDDEDMMSRQGHEREANAFAGLVLVPDASLNAIDDRQRPIGVSEYGDWLAPVCRALGVSVEVVLRRLLDVGRLDADSYRDYRAFVAAQPRREDEGGTRMYRHREPKHLFGDTFVRTVLDALHARRITVTKASRYLDGIKLSDIHQLERHVAGR